MESEQRISICLYLVGFRTKGLERLRRTHPHPLDHQVNGLKNIKCSFCGRQKRERLQL